MPHIHEKPGQHDFTASAFIVLKDKGEPRILLFKHKQRGVFMQPGGHVELEETPWECIKHEVLEEVGYDISQLQVLQPNYYLKSLTSGLLHPLPAMLGTYAVKADGSHMHTDIAFAFTTTEESKYIGDGEEADEYVWLSAGDLTAIPQDEIIENVREIALYGLRELYIKWTPVLSRSYP